MNIEPINDPTRTTTETAIAPSTTTQGTGSRANTCGPDPSSPSNYDPRLAAQFVGYTLLLAGGPMDKTVMSRLIYMADREYAKRNCAPFLDDIHRALPNGPICQRALDGLNGKRDRAVFERYVRRDGDTLTLAAGLREEDFGDLNAAAFAIAEDLFTRHGHLSRDEIVAFTHGADFPEWAEAFAAIADEGAIAGDITDEAFARAAGVDPDSYAAIAEAERGAASA